MAVLGRRVFCGCAASSFRPAALGADKSRSREPAAFIHFIVTVRCCLPAYLRRDQLPKKYVIDLPLAIVSLAGGLGVLVCTYWLDFAGRAPAYNDYLALLTLSFLCCLAAGGFFFFGRGWMRAAAFLVAYLIFMVSM